MNAQSSSSGIQPNESRLRRLRRWIGTGVFETERGACMAERGNYVGFWRTDGGADGDWSAVVTGDSGQRLTRVARSDGTVRRSGIAPGGTGTG